MHQQLFSTATEVVQAGGGEPAVIITETTTTNVDMVHDGMFLIKISFWEREAFGS